MLKTLCENGRKVIFLLYVQEYIFFPLIITKDKVPNHGVGSPKLFDTNWSQSSWGD